MHQQVHLQIVKIKDIVRLRPNAAKTSWALVQMPKVPRPADCTKPLTNGAVEAIGWWL